MKRDGVGAGGHWDDVGEPHAVAAVAALNDGSRRSIYGFVVKTGRPVTRQEVAEAVGMSEKLAAFHLNRLVAAELLVSGTASERRFGARGRRPRLYQRSPRDVTVTLPPRRPDILAQMLVAAVTSGRHEESTLETALRVAEDQGRELGAENRSLRRSGRVGAERAVALAESALVGRGYESVRTGPTELTLRNCPYWPVAQAAPELVCQMNHRFLLGLLDGLDVRSLRAVMAPRLGQCCVQLRG